MAVQITDHSGNPVDLHSEVDGVSGDQLIKHLIPDGAATDAKLDDVLDLLRGGIGVAELHQSGAHDAAAPWISTPVSTPAAGHNKTLLGMSALFGTFGGSGTWANDDLFLVQIQGSAAVVYQFFFDYGSVIASNDFGPKSICTIHLPFPAKLLTAGEGLTVVAVVARNGVAPGLGVLTFDMTLNLFVGEI